MSSLQTHRSSQLPHNDTRHSSPNYYGNHQQQRGYRRNVQRRPYYPSSGVGSYPTVIDDVFAQQYSHQTSAFQPPRPYYSVDMVFLPSVVVDNYGQYGLIWRYCPVPNYELIDDSYVTNDPSGILDHINWLIDQEANSAFNFGFLYDHLFDREDNVDGHDEEKENDDAVLKYLNIRTHHSLAKDGVNPTVVSDIEQETCAICQSEYEDEESIGKLQCGHEYHTDCIKQWLWRKKDCPMCRASVLPSQEQRL
nr:uncharacterized protein LOC104090783 [Nicotiana tomentosiformis]